MKRRLLIPILLLALGLVLGGALVLLGLTRGWLSNTRMGPSVAAPGVVGGAKAASSAPVALAEDPGRLKGNGPLVVRALEVAGSIRDGDWAALAGAVHPEKGVTFTPYSSVSDSDLCFTAKEVAAFGGDGKTYLWGSYDGSGAPMSLTVGEYFAKFVNNADYTCAPFLAVNRVMSCGNAVENVADAYPEAEFVELYYNGLNEVNEGFDWCALKLVFEPVDGELMLVGVIHSEWTI